MKNYALTRQTFLGMICFLLLAGCNKAKVEQTNRTIEKSTKVPCSPYRNVTGFNAMFSDLNVVTNCLGYLCQSGNFVTTTLSNGILTDPYNNNSIFVFSSNQVITPAEQNDVMLAAKAWANANAPAGYATHNITYSPNYIVGQTSAVIIITVVYRKCVAGPPAG
jgi:hypothetical protein